MERIDIILALLSGNEIVGTTRFQKLIFLTQFGKDKISDKDLFNFEAYKFGPVSAKLYDDLEFLSNIGYIEKSNERGDIIENSIDNIENLNFDQLINEKDKVITVEEVDDRGGSTTSDDNVVYRITKKGLKYLDENKVLQNPETSKILGIKNKFQKWTLRELLQYIYTKYPNFATESEIKNKIL